MILAPPQLAELCSFAHVADKEARTDLAGGYIRNEEDYTSNVTGALRRIINANSQTGLRATSYLLPVSEERRTGCDATVLISGDDATKVTLFEAKLPGLAGGTKRWDYRQTASGDSHFSDQLMRQRRQVPRFAVFEMFYLDWALGAQPSHLPDEGSACVWHAEAVTFDAARGSAPGPWAQQDLDALLRRQALGIGNVLATVVSCAEGEALSRAPAGEEGAELFAREFELEGPVLHVESRSE